MNRLPAQEPFKIVRQGCGRVIAARRLFPQAFQTDSFQIAWNGWVQQSRADRFFLNYLP
jgi:hypothetical protein